LEVDNIWKIEKNYEKKLWSSRDQNIAIFVFSVFNYFKTNAALVVFGSTPLMNEIDTLLIFFLLNMDFLAPKPRFFEKKT
jgi:hypothetical protein